MLFWIEFNGIEFNWIQWNWIELDWIELNWIELDWIGLDWIREERQKVVVHKLVCIHLLGVKSFIHVYEEPIHPKSSTKFVEVKYI